LGFSGNSKIQFLANSPAFAWGIVSKSSPAGRCDPNQMIDPIRAALPVTFGKCGALHGLLLRRKKYFVLLHRRDGRVVDCGGLENR